MRVLITGSRDWTDEVTIRGALLPLQEDELCHGDARGADKIAGRIAEELGWKVTPFPVDTSIDGPWPAAGHHRNRRMFDAFKPDLVLAFPLPQSRGTVGMVDYATSKGCIVVTHVTTEEAK